MAAFTPIRPPGRARTWLVLAALATLWLPVLGVWFGSRNLTGASLLPWLSDAAYLGALRRSLTLLTWLVGSGMVIGWPAGVWLGLHRFGGRQLFLGSLCLPLLLPPFLVSIALSFLRPWLPYAWQDIVDGLPGCILTGCQLVLPMAIASAMWVASQVTDGERAAALFAGGPWTLFRYTCRRASMPVLAATTLAALRVLSDPGPSQIMGYHGVASEVMIAFASRYDPVQAGQKALTFSLLLVPLLIPMVWILASNLNNGLARQESGSSSASSRYAPTHAKGCSTLATFLALLLFAPVFAGLARPLLVPTISGVLAQALRTLSESAGITLFHAAVAGTTAAGVGWVLASWAGRSRIHRSIVLSSALLLLSLPTSLHALGILSITHELPAFLDPILRSRWRVGCTLGLALSPIPTVACLWARAGLSPRQEEQAALHRIGSVRFASRVLVPQVLPAVLASALAVAILAVAEVSSTLLLQPPGETTFPGRLFSMMDNASERLVASLAAVYLGAALIGVLGVLFTLHRHRLRRRH